MMRILLVDDISENSYVLRTLLEAHGYFVEPARHGAEALHRALANPPNLVISDLLMPVMDGFALLRHWKSDPKLRTIPFVVYTATYTGPKDERLALDLGADAFLRKPAEPERFVERISEVLGMACRGELSPPQQPRADDGELLEEYSQVLIRKLEQKALQLEESNRALQEDILRRRHAEAEAKRFLDDAQRAQAALLRMLTLQRQSEEALIESEARLRLALVAARMGTFDWDMLHDRVTWTSRNGTRCGVPEQFEGTFAELAQHIHAADREEIEADIQRCIATSQPFAREFRIPDENGDEHWLSGRGEFEFDSRGNAVRLRGVVLEVTDRKRIELELMEKEQLLSESQRIARIGSWRWDRNGRFTCSDEAFRILGVDPVTFVWTAESFAGLLHPNDRALLTGWLNACWTGAPHEPIEVRAILPDDVMRAIGVCGGLKCDATGQPSHIAGTLQDVTERKRAEAALRESEANLTASQELAKLGSWELPVEAEGATWSVQMYRFFGRNPVLGPPTNGEMLELIHPEDRAIVAATNERLKREGGSATIVLRTNPACGVDKWLEGIVVARSDESGRTLRLIGTLQDVTERKTLEGRLRHSQKMEAMGQLAGGIAHDFNNILAAIVGNAEYAQLELPAENTARVSIEEILRAGQRAMDLVQRILAFSRPQGDLLRPIQLQPVLEEAERLLRATLPAGIELSFHAPPGLPIVRADATQIHQIVLNLVTNAWHALDSQPGRIEARLEGLRVDTTLSQQHPELRPGPYVRLSVSDTGKGMDAATLEHIFEPFFTTKPAGQGAGLGLSVVHGIVRGHGGTIFAESQLGRGATFYVFLPAAIEDVSVPCVEAPAARETRGHGERILYIDDEEALVFLAVRFLESSGYRVEGFTRVQDALAAFGARPQSFDAIITDYNMPGMSGMELAQQLLRIRPEASIALTSGYLRPAEIEAAHSLGIREVIPKPYLVDELAPLVQRLLAKAPVMESARHA